MEKISIIYDCREFFSPIYKHFFPLFWKINFFVNFPTKRERLICFSYVGKIKFREKIEPTYQKKLKFVKKNPVFRYLKRGMG